MNPEIRTRWVEALRSGKYSQGKSALRTDDTYCCLGVLCDLYNPSKWVQQGNPYITGNYTFAKELVVLPEEVVEWAGLANNNPNAYSGAGLASMNDSGSTFEEIAKLIEVSF